MQSLIIFALLASVSGQYYRIYNTLAQEFTATITTGTGVSAQDVNVTLPSNGVYPPSGYASGVAGSSLTLTGLFDNQGVSLINSAQQIALAPNLTRTFSTFALYNSANQGNQTVPYSVYVFTDSSSGFNSTTTGFVQAYNFAASTFGTLTVTSTFANFNTLTVNAGPQGGTAGFYQAEPAGTYTVTATPASGAAISANVQVVAGNFYTVFFASPNGVLVATPTFDLTGANSSAISTAGPNTTAGTSGVTPTTGALTPTTGVIATTGITTAAPQTTGVTTSRATTGVTSASTATSTNAATSATTASTGSTTDNNSSSASSIVVAASMLLVALVL